MALGFVSYEVKNDEAFIRKLRETRKQVSNLSPAFAQIADDFYTSQRAIFQLKSPGGYPDLNPIYKERKKRKHGFEYPILRATGKLESAATDKTDQGNITKITKTSLTIGVNGSVIPYARAHQEGLGRMPVRKILFIGPEAGSPKIPATAGRLQRWIDILEGYTVATSKKGLKDG